MTIITPNAYRRGIFVLEGLPRNNSLKENRTADSGFSFAKSKRKATKVFVSGT